MESVSILCSANSQRPTASGWADSKRHKKSRFETLFYPQYNYAQFTRIFRAYQNVYKQIYTFVRRL